MQYKLQKDKKSNEEFFIYKPKFIKNNKKNVKNSNKNSPFDKLSELRLR